MAEQLHEIFYHYDEFGQPSEARRELVARRKWLRDGELVCLRPAKALPLDITHLLTGPTPKFAISEEE